MFRSIASAIWENTYGLLVDDGRLAGGAVLALAVSAVTAAVSGEEFQTIGGWLLFVLVGALLLANLYAAGRNARRRTS